MSLRYRNHLSDLTAVRFVYPYVLLTAGAIPNHPLKLPKLMAPPKCLNCKIDFEDYFYKSRF